MRDGVAGDFGLGESTWASLLVPARLGVLGMMRDGGGSLGTILAHRGASRLRTDLGCGVEHLVLSVRDDQLRHLLAVRVRDTE